MEYITLKETKVPVVAKADVVVIGGGPAGVGAAISAARAGAYTVLVEQFGSLGGINTIGLMSISHGGEYLSPLSREIFDRLVLGEYAVNLAEKYPELFSSELIHWRPTIGSNARNLIAYDPYMTGCVINDMMEEAGVRLMFRTLFTDTVMEGKSIEAVIIENVSGRQAIKGEIFIDCTGRGHVVARSGAPYVSAKDEFGFPMPMGLMWKMSNVDINKILEYEKQDPELKGVIAKAQSKGELPYYRLRKSPEQMQGSYDYTYTGHPRLEMMQSVYPGDILLWAPSIHDWGLDGAEKAEDLTRAEIQIRKEIVSELNFLKKYVPGFENAHLAAIAAMMGIREGRHPIGEYVLKKEDITSGRKFEDTVLTIFKHSPFDVRRMELGNKTEINIPWRCLIASEVTNLLLAGDNISAEHGAFLDNRGFPKSMGLGGVAGKGAALSVKKNINPRDVNASEILKTTK